MVHDFNAVVAPSQQWMYGTQLTSTKFGNFPMHYTFNTPVGALAANLVFLMALLGMIGAALTLPGIAAIALALGMAIDANVLINERIREELRNGAACLDSA